jgi:hypothetical protein
MHIRFDKISILLRFPVERGIAKGVRLKRGSGYGTDAERNGCGTERIRRNGTDMGLKCGTERIWG